MVTDGRAYPPIEGGQSLAEAKPFHITDPVFLRGLETFLERKCWTFILGGPLCFQETIMGLSQLARRFNCDAHGDPIVSSGRSEEKRLDPKPTKIFELPAEPPAKSKVEELRETVADIPAKRGKGRPKTGQVKPWVSLGMTKSTYYVKKSKGEV
jgi:hypothetical protein